LKKLNFMNNDAQIIKRCWSICIYFGTGHCHPGASDIWSYISGVKTPGRILVKGSREKPITNPLLTWGVDGRK
jgi:hypothetical protein